MSASSNIHLDSDEFGKFFSEYRGHFVRIAYSYVRDMDAAKDIVTDSFAYLWERRGELTSHDNLKGYVYYCVRNRCNSHLRQRLIHLKAHDELTKTARWEIQAGLDSLGSDEISDRLFQQEVIDIFRQALDRMPARTRDIFQASRQEGMTYQQIADKYGLTLRKVTYEIQSALQHLRRSLKDYLPEE